MQRQEITFVVIKQAGKVVRISKAFLYQPALRFRGGGIKWYEEAKLPKTGEKKPQLLNEPG